jgi:hypothetical protein
MLSECLPEVKKQILSLFLIVEKLFLYVVALLIISTLHIIAFCPSEPLINQKNSCCQVVLFARDKIVWSPFEFMTLPSAIIPRGRHAQGTQQLCHVSNV